MRAAALSLLAALAAAGSTGCETFGPRTCDTSLAGNPPVTFTGGQAQGGVYMSSPWVGELLSFPGGQRYSLVHGLGSTPAWVQSYLSFDQLGTQDGGTLAPATGNQVEIVSVDDTAIGVANESCTDYWLLVVAGTGTAPPGP